jgi:hypothetical protein
MRGVPGNRHPYRDPRPFAGADVDAEFKQFTVDARCAPERILAAHLSDQLAHLFGNRWPAGLAVTNFPCPEQAEALAVPGNDGLRFDDDQGRSPIAPNFAQPGRRFSVDSHNDRILPTSWNARPHQSSPRLKSSNSIVAPGFVRGVKPNHANKTPRRRRR